MSSVKYYEEPTSVKSAVHALDGIEYKVTVARYKDGVYLNVRAADIREEYVNTVDLTGDFWKKGKNYENN